MSVERSRDEREKEREEEKKKEGKEKEGERVGEREVIALSETYTIVESLTVCAFSVFLYLQAPSPATRGSS